MVVIRSSDVTSRTVSSFEDLYLEPKLCGALAAAGYDTPSPVQEAALPACLAGTDVVVQATSGTGKTVVISCTCLCQAVKSSAPSNTVKVLVVAPTRELAIQIQDITIAIGRHYCPEVACHSLIGGLSFEDDRRKLNMRADIVVGTPGRLISLIRSRQLVLSSVAVFVLDEADRLLDSTMCSQTAELYEALPKRKQVVALSATFGDSAIAHVLPMMKGPRRFDVRDTGNSAPAAVRHLFACTPSIEPSATKLSRASHARFVEEKWKLLTKLMRTVMFNQALIFCNDPSAAPSLAARLSALGIPSTHISARLAQPERLAALSALRALRLRAAVTSDVLARGIDLEYINLVINFDLPYSSETYAHRLGRAGRFGTSALAVTLVRPGEVAVARDYASSAGCGSFQELPDVIPEEWYYRQAEGAAAESFQALSLQSYNSNYPALDEGMYPLTGNRSRKEVANGEQHWRKRKLCGDEKNYHDRNDDEVMFGSSVGEAESWFAGLDTMHAAVGAKIPLLDAQEASGSGTDAWDAWTGFSGGEMQWFLECANLGSHGSQSVHGNAPMPQCRTHASEDGEHAKLGGRDLKCDLSHLEKHLESSRIGGNVEG